MKGIKKGIFTLITILLILLFAYNVYNFVNLKVLNNKMTSIFGYSVLEVVSGSMEPTIHVGDMIVIDTTASDFKVGNVVTFTDDNGAFVTHRIIRIEEDLFITKGDNNNSEDEGIASSRIVGKYVKRIPNMGRVVAAFKNPFTMAMIFLIGILTCVLISTDKNGEPILSEDEKEYEEFLKSKNDYVDFPKKKKESVSSKSPVNEIEDEVEVPKKKAPSKKVSSKKESEKAVPKKTVTTEKKKAKSKVGELKSSKTSTSTVKKDSKKGTETKKTAVSKKTTSSTKKSANASKKTSATKVKSTKSVKTSTKK